MPLLEPWLTNVEPEVTPRPWVKWAYRPARAQDIPGAFMRAHATAIQPSVGPVFLPAICSRRRICSLKLAWLAMTVGTVQAGTRSRAVSHSRPALAWSTAYQATPVWSAGRRVTTLASLQSSK